MEDFGASTSAESFLAASADHQDGVFRMIQYATKLLGALHHSKRRAGQLQSISFNIDNARAMTRTFGFIYAIQTLRNEGLAQLERVSAVSLLGYHPLEFGYWLLTVTGAEYKGWRRGLARVVSLLGAIYGVCEIVAAARRLKALRAEREQLLAQAYDEADTLGGGVIAEADADLVETEMETVRRQAWKLGVDTLMCANWALDHSKLGFGEGTVGALGCCSAYLGLRLKWNAHEDMLLQGIAAQEAGMIEDDASPRSTASGRRKSQ